MIGVDLSKHNGEIDFQKTIDNINFAILRAGYGVSYLPDKQKDPLFEYYYKGFRGNRPMGAYYFTYANSVGDGKKEAENCLKYIDGKHFDLPIYYDLEDDVKHVVPKGIVNTIAREFVDRIKAAGYKPGIYCNLNWAKNYINLDLFKDCSIWIAMYGKNDGNIPSTKPSVHYDIWQYTSEGRVPGINGRVDINIMDSTPTPEPSDYSYTQFVKDIQVAEGQTGKWVDGIAGKRTLELTPTISRYKNPRNACVKPVQKYLYYLGYTDVGVADGIAGAKFEKAVKQYQGDNGCVMDGELTAHNKTWKKLLKIA